MKVLEIGLGYGSVSQKLIDHNAHYHGLDIASGPIQMVENRLKQSKKVCRVQLGSILSPPFSKETFDCIIAIGCLHHTGNLKLAIDNVYNLLKPNGNAVIMVYSALSYRQLFSSPFRTISRLFGNYRIYDNNQFQSSKRFRAAYDTNIEGNAAPQTEFVTKAELKYMFSKFNNVSIESQNIGNEGIFRFIPRRLACMLFGATLGLDLYCRIQK
jgi:SAM-dependent methyltransferase